MPLEKWDKSNALIVYWFDDSGKSAIGTVISDPFDTHDSLHRSGKKR